MADQNNYSELVNAVKLGNQNLSQAVVNLTKAITSVFPNSGATASTASAGAATLPSNPVGFIEVTLPSGTLVKVPYYNV